ncbi:MAG: hypothetical protein AB1489_00115 [Acidobacteriota bacterium]
MDHQYSTVRESLYTIAAGLLVVVFCLLLLYQDANFFWVDDAQSQHIPALWDIARSWQEGELPLLSPYSWFGGALAAEYQYGIFSLSTSLIFFLIWKLQLSLPTTAALFSIIHLSITAAGGFRLARQRALSIDLSMMVGLVAALNGWLLLWAAISWTPGMTSFTWLPWAWWGLEGSLQEGNNAVRCILAGFFIYLILTAGWPFTLLMIGLITVWLALRQWRVNHSIKRLSRLAVAWLIALGLAAPALLMLTEYSDQTIRSKIGLVAQWQLIVPVSSLPGLILPSFTVTWVAALGPLPHASVELACGLAPTVILLAALILLRKQFIKKVRWELGLFVVTLLLSVSPSFFPFRWSFRWLPFLHLVLAIVAAEGLALLRTKKIADDNLLNQEITGSTKQFIKRYQNNLGVWALCSVLIVLAISQLLKLDLTDSNFSLGINLALISTIWAVVERFLAITATLQRWAIVAVVFVAFAVTYYYIPTNTEIPRWQFPEMRTATPLDPEIRYLSLYDYWDTFKTYQPNLGPVLRPGNTAMYAGLQLVNGYSAMAPIKLAYLLGFSGHGYMNRDIAKNILQKEIGAEGLLQVIGVDGLIIPASLRKETTNLTQQGWQQVANFDEGTIFHRIGPRSLRVRSLSSVQLTSSNDDALNWFETRIETAAPFLLWGQAASSGQQLSFAATSVKLVAETRLRAIAEVEPLSSSGESLVLFSRPWYPGYRATLNGKEVPVEIVNFIMPAVRLPAGAQGELILEYRPNSFVIGSGIALATILLTVLGLGWMLWQRRPAMVAANQTA